VSKPYLAPLGTVLETQEEMKFEIGKHYRSRRGEKWRVVALDGVGKYPVIAVQSHQRVEAFTLNGDAIGPAEGSINDLLSEWTDPPQHGVTCKKAPHTRGGYLHGENDDTPYNVDGCNYCGRCHIAL